MGTDGQLFPEEVATDTRYFVGVRGYLNASGWPVVRATYELVSDHPSSNAAGNEVARIQRQPYLDALDASWARQAEEATT